MKQSPVYRPSSGPSPGLTRYESAPGSFLSSVADSVISEGGASGFHSVVGSRPGPDSAGTLPKTRFFAGGGGGESSSHSCLSSPESSGVQRLPSTNFAAAGEDNGSNQKAKAAAAAAGDGGGGDHLMRQCSSPAGFFSQLMVDNGEFSLYPLLSGLFNISPSSLSYIELDPQIIEIAIRSPNS